MRYYLCANIINRETKEKKEYVLIISKHWNVFPCYLEKDKFLDILENKSLDIYIFSLEEAQEYCKSLSTSYRKKDFILYKNEKGEIIETIKDHKDIHTKSNSTFEFYFKKIDSSKCPFKVKEILSTVKTSYTKAKITKK